MAYRLTFSLISLLALWQVSALAADEVPPSLAPTAPIELPSHLKGEKPAPPEVSSESPDSIPPPLTPSSTLPAVPPVPTEATREQKAQTVPPTNLPAVIAPQVQAQEFHTTPGANVDLSSNAYAKLLIPLYLRENPNFGFQMDFSMNGLGGNQTLYNGVKSNNTSAGRFQFEWEPSAIQRIGVLSLGPMVAVYPMGGQNAPADGRFSLWSFGGQVRYQARFFKEQIIVPFVEFGMQRLSYRLIPSIPGNALSNPHGTMLIGTQSLGGMILLDWFSHAEGSAFFDDCGVRRTYLLAEIQKPQGSNKDILLAGHSYFFGLRFEF